MIQLMPIHREPKENDGDDVSRGDDYLTQKEEQQTLAEVDIKDKGHHGPEKVFHTDVRNTVQEVKGGALQLIQ